MADLKHELLNLINEIVTGFVKAAAGFSTYLLIALLSVVGLIGNNMFLGKKMTLWQSIGLTALAFSTALITGIICYKSDLGLTGYILTWFVPYASDKIVLAIMGFDWSKSIRQALREWFKGMADKMK